MQHGMARIFISAVAVSGLAVTSCNKSTPQKKAKTSPAPAYDTSTSSITSTGGWTSTSTLGSGVDIYCSQAAGNVLTVTQGQAVTWTFEARSLSGGGAGSITSITASPQPGSMQISSPTVTFTPTNQQELTGTLTVNGTDSTGQTGNKIFSWQSATGGGLLGGQGGGFNFANILTSVLPGLLSGNFNPQSLLGAFTGGGTTTTGTGTGIGGLTGNTGLGTGATGTTTGATGTTGNTTGAGNPW